MNINEIEKLVEKYYDGETTLSEERILQGFFSGDNVPAHLEYMKMQFAFYENEHEVRLEDANFRDNIMESLEDKGRILKFRLQRPVIYTVYSAVITILIALAIFLFNFLSVHDSTAISQSTINDPEEAYHETKQALILVSTYVDKAMVECTDISKFEEYRQIIFYK